MIHTIKFKGSAEDFRFVTEIANVLMSGNERVAAAIRAGMPIRYVADGRAVLFRESTDFPVKRAKVLVSRLQKLLENH